MLPPPAPLAAVLVTMAAVTLALGARRFVGQHATDWRLAPYGVTATSFGIAVAGFLVPCSVVARFAGQFDAGLAAAAIAGAMLLVWTFVRPEKQPRIRSPMPEKQPRIRSPMQPRIRGPMQPIGGRRRGAL